MQGGRYAAYCNLAINVLETLSFLQRFKSFVQDLGSGSGAEVCHFMSDEEFISHGKKLA